MTARGLDWHQAESEIRRFLHVLWQPGDVREVRIPKHNRYSHTASGYFDDPEKLITAVRPWDGRANIYVTLNPTKESLLARAYSRIEEKAEHTTADADVLCRDWLFIDIDSERESGISATPTEVAEAAAVADRIQEFLRAQGWPEGIRALSGNGYYLLYRVDLPNDNTSRDLCSAIHPPGQAVRCGW